MCGSYGNVCIILGTLGIQIYDFSCIEFTVSVCTFGLTFYIMFHWVIFYDIWMTSAAALVWNADRTLSVYCYILNNA